ncbi:hypothetical protein WME91_11745 [Sorangium sp. So ce269]
MVSYVRAGGKLTLEDPWLTVLGLLLLHLLVRALLFPAFWERFLLAHYLFFALVAVRLLRLAPRVAPIGEEHPRVSQTSSPAAGPAPG